jgi:hypothetical protein
MCDMRDCPRAAPVGDRSAAQRAEEPVVRFHERLVEKRGRHTERCAEVVKRLKARTGGAALELADGSRRDGHPISEARLTKPGQLPSHPQA